MILIGKINQIVQSVHFKTGSTQFVHNSIFASSAHFILFPQFVYISNEKFLILDQIIE